MVKTVKMPAAAAAVRTRRAYFDCRFGQLHVRTAFPTTGGFDEQTTLVCLHPSASSSRIFERFLPEIATARSVYAPDLPGCGESDAAAAHAPRDAAHAVSDLAGDLRLKHIDVLGFQDGAVAAVELAAARPELVRRVVVIGMPPAEGLAAARQETLVLRLKLGAADDTQWARAFLPNARFADLADYTADLFDAAPKTLARQISAFLDARG